MLNISDLKVALDAETGLVRAIDGLSLCIRRGETFALVGESGCGKSMTALALMRLLPENGRVTDGRLDIDSTEVFSLPESSMRTIRGGKIGMIFQEPGTSLNPVMRVGEQIVEAIETHTALRGAAARAKAIDWLRRVGIPAPEKRIDDYPHQMSGGMRQRVMIAMALACNPQLMIADEPTTALDVTIQAQILDLMNTLKQETGAAILFITHDLGVIAEMSQHVAVMYAGRMMEYADAKTLYASPKNPYTVGLLGSIPVLGKNSGGGRLKTIPGVVPSLLQLPEGCLFSDRCPDVFDDCRRVAPAMVPVGENHFVRCLKYV